MPDKMYEAIIKENAWISDAYSVINYR
jgi:hypothetical protein